MIANLRFFYALGIVAPAKQFRNEVKEWSDSGTRKEKCFAFLAYKEIYPPPHYTQTNTRQTFPKHSPGVFPFSSAYAGSFRKAQVRIMTSALSSAVTTVSNFPRCTFRLRLKELRRVLRVLRQSALP